MQVFERYQLFILHTTKSILFLGVFSCGFVAVSLYKFELTLSNRIVNLYLPVATKYYAF